MKVYVEGKVYLLNTSIGTYFLEAFRHAFPGGAPPANDMWVNLFDTLMKLRTEEVH